MSQNIDNCAILMGQVDDIVSGHTFKNVRRSRPQGVMKAGIDGVPPEDKAAAQLRNPAGMRLSTATSRTRPTSTWASPPRWVRLCLRTTRSSRRAAAPTSAAV